MKNVNVLNHFIIGLVCIGLTGCASVPMGLLKPSKESLKNRQLQMRQYETKDEEKIISSVAGVLQDLGFTLDSSETKLGVIIASTRADATDAGQIAGAVVLDVLCALGGSYSNNMALCDKEQKVKASVVVKSSLDSSKMVVRVTFQRIVWNMQNNLSKIETINEQEIYEKFYSGLSKAIFLEAHKI
ncbi:MAG: hypothetical protein ABH869_05705 [Candidatus Omnitrophota bacterium]